MLPNLRIIYGSRLAINDLSVYSLKTYAPSNNPPKKWLSAMHEVQRKTSRQILPFLMDADKDKDMKLSRVETTEALEVSFSDTIHVPILFTFHSNFIVAL